MAVYVGKTGHIITLATGQVLDDCTKLAMKVTKPDGTVVEWVATQSVTPGSLEYTTQAGDLSLSGQYFIQTLLEWGAESSHLGNPPFILDVLPLPPAWSNIDAVRLELGKGPSVDLLADNELAYFLTRSNGNVLLAASFAAESLAGYYTDLVDKSMGGSSVSLSQKAESWRKKAAALKTQALNPSLTPRASSSTPRTLKFDIGQHDNPGLASGTTVGDEVW